MKSMSHIFDNFTYGYLFIIYVYIYKYKIVTNSPYVDALTKKF